MARISVTFFPGPGPEGGEVHAFELQRLFTLASWREEPFSPGAALGDAWCASTRVGATWCVELELSTRRAFWCDRVEVAGPAGLERTIQVGMVWPAARLLAFRLGAELPMHPSWRRRRTHFGPNQMPLPAVDFAAQALLYEARLSQLRAALASRGTCTNEGALDGILSWTGPFPCWGQRDPGPGAPGGEGISFTTGWQGVPAFARYAAEAGAAAVSREWAFYKADGTPVLPEDFDDGYQPEVRSEAGWKLPAWADVMPDPLPLPQSLSHASRVYRWCDAAWEMTGSPLARRGIVLGAQHALLELSHRGQVINEPGNVSQNLSTQEALSLLLPGQGLAWNRAHGHAGLRVAMAWRMGLRSASVRDWGVRLCAAMERSSTVPGCVTSAVIPEGAEGQRVTQGFHEDIAALGARALARAMGFVAPSFSVRIAESLYMRTFPVGDYYGAVEPLHYPWVAPQGGPPYLELTQGNGHPALPGHPGGPSYGDVLLAVLAHELDDHNYLDATLRFGVPQDTLTEKRQALEAEQDVGTRNAQAFLLAALQQGGY
jgi:hypothetical protein